MLELIEWLRAAKEMADIDWDFVKADTLQEVIDHIVNNQTKEV